MKEFVLPSEGFIRLKDVLKVIPVSTTQWYRGIAEGIYPSSLKLGPNMAVWNVADIRNFIASVLSEEVTV